MLDNEEQKRKLSKEDISFLVGLQNELRTQPTLCTANPKFWVIKDVMKVASDDGEYEEYEYDYEHFDCFKDLVEYLINEEVIEDGKYEDLDDLPYEIQEACLLKQFKEEEYICENTFFLTKREAEEHLETNYYHYSSKAHIYAMSAWRSPQFERLYDILFNIDLEEIL